MRLILDSSAERERLRALVTEDINWQEYQSGPVVHRDMINGMFYALLLCCGWLTPCARRRRYHARMTSRPGKKAQIYTVYGAIRFCHAPLAICSVQHDLRGRVGIYYIYDLISMGKFSSHLVPVKRISLWQQLSAKETH
jgi:hypothetical protein